jgi:hypothetical protein
MCGFLCRAGVGTRGVRAVHGNIWRLLFGSACVFYMCGSQQGYCGQCVGMELCPYKHKDTSTHSSMTALTEQRHSDMGIDAWSQSLIDSPLGVAFRTFFQEIFADTVSTDQDPTSTLDSCIEETAVSTDQNTASILDSCIDAVVAAEVSFAEIGKDMNFLSPSFFPDAVKLVLCYRKNGGSSRNLIDFLHEYGQLYYKFPWAQKYLGDVSAYIVNTADILFERYKEQALYMLSHIINREPPPNILTNPFNFHVVWARLSTVIAAQSTAGPEGVELECATLCAFEILSACIDKYQENEHVLKNLAFIPDFIEHVAPLYDIDTVVNVLMELLDGKWEAAQFLGFSVLEELCHDSCLAIIRILAKNENVEAARCFFSALANKRHNILLADECFLDFAQALIDCVWSLETADDAGSFFAYATRLLNGIVVRSGPFTLEKAEEEWYLNLLNSISANLAEEGNNKGFEEMFGNLIKDWLDFGIPARYYGIIGLLLLKVADCHCLGLFDDIRYLYPFSPDDVSWGMVELLLKPMGCYFLYLHNVFELCQG